MQDIEYIVDLFDVQKAPYSNGLYLPWLPAQAQLLFIGGLDVVG